ncbi:MAG: zinc-dependent metalloprotease family protein [Bacteroidota bacterium]
MKKQLLVAITFVFSVCSIQAQTDKFWSTHTGASDKITTDKGVARLSFPQKFDLYDLNTESLRQTLFSMQGATSRNGVVITLPNADGKLEQFQMFEASNFDDALQARFPQIRAYSGKGITDKYATLKLSISPQGIQTMIFRTDRENEFIEPYSQDHTVYAVFKSQRVKGQLAWSCSTDDKQLVTDLSFKANQTANANKSSAGQLKTMRLAQSCNGEYANYFGATTSAQVALVLAAYNNTLTRCNGVYEKDLALHLNLVNETTNVIYYDPATDPYSTTLSNWNTELQKALNTTLTGVGTTLAANNAAYDIGHMFGASGGGGNAGCIGCPCVNGTAAGTGSTKGRGITSPADGIPQGDNFDIDYVVHEIGHQLGGNHTFSNSNEGSGVNKEVGSGITIMGYAGITSQDIAPHSIAFYHEASIAQIQANLATKSCPVTTSLTGVNATPVIAPISNYTIPKSTSFVLTGSATDADVADALTYSWEQNDDGASSTGVNSDADVAKTVGPNFISFSPTASPSRYFPRVTSILANLQTTGCIATPCDAGMKSEALSSVARTLNFRLTVRDNVPYSSTAPVTVGQTSFTDMTVTVSGTAGPFLVSVPNTAVTWTAGTNENVTWNVAGTDGNGINAAFVDIFLIVNGNFDAPIQLASKVPNNGSTTVTVPNNVGATNRIMVRGYQHIFFDISNVNFTINAPAATFAVTEASEQSFEGCTPSSATYNFNYSALGGFAGTTTFATTGEPAGSTVSFSPSSISADGPVTMTVNGLTGVTAGNYNITMTATSGSITQIIPYYLFIGLSDVTLTTPADLTTGTSNSVTLNWNPSTGATSYDVQVATDAAFTTIISSGNVTSNAYTVSGLIDATDYYWRVLPKNASCTGSFSTPYKFTTGTTVCNTFASSDNLGVNIPDNSPTGLTSTLVVPSGMTNISDINVPIYITHSFIGDITGTLKSPAGTTITIFAQPCIDDYHDPINATFDDAGVTGVCAASPGGLTGTILPTQALSAFNGQDPTGTWTLKIVDAGTADIGQIQSWSLNICSATLGVAQNTLSNFALYPNPNRGNFTIQFDSKTNSDIAISVYDLRGRTIMSNKYTNTGLFSQNINLDRVQSGVYMVTVQDGDTKVVKRIIVE